MLWAPWYASCFFLHIARTRIPAVRKLQKKSFLTLWRECMEPFASGTAHSISVSLWCRSIYFVLSTWLDSAATKMWAWGVWKWLAKVKTWKRHLQCNLLATFYFFLVCRPVASLSAFRQHVELGRRAGSFFSFENTKCWKCDWSKTSRYSCDSHFLWQELTFAELPSIYRLQHIWGVCLKSMCVNVTLDLSDVSSVATFARIEV